MNILNSTSDSSNNHLQTRINFNESKKRKSSLIFNELTDRIVQSQKPPLLKIQTSFKTKNQTWTLTNLQKRNQQRVTITCL